MPKMGLVQHVARYAVAITRHVVMSWLNQMINLKYHDMPELSPHFEVHLMGEVHQKQAKLQNTRIRSRARHCYTQMLPDWYT